MHQHATLSRQVALTVNLFDRKVFVHATLHTCLTYKRDLVISATPLPQGQGLSKQDRIGSSSPYSGSNF